MKQKTALALPKALPQVKRLQAPSIRTSVQVFFFVLIGFAAIGKSAATAFPGWTLLTTVSLHAICPFGGVVTICNLIATGTFVQKIHDSAIILAALVAILAVIAGPVLCGWICPLGTIQDLLSRFGKKMFKGRYNRFVPPSVHKILSYLRYGVLIWVVAMTIISGQLAFSSIDPYHALFHFWSSEAALGGTIILAITLISSLFVARPWCKYACPFGALLGLSNKIRIFTIRRNPATCIRCNRCDRSCPMNITVSRAGSVRDVQCISCLECTSDRSCPISDTVNLAWAVVNESKKGANTNEN